MAPPTDPNVPFVVTTASTSIQSLLGLLPTERATRQATYVVFPAAGGYVVVRWSEVEALADEHGIDASTFISQVPGLPVPVTPQVVSTPSPDVTHLSLPAVLVSNGQVVRVLADESRAVAPPVRDPFTPPQMIPESGVLGGWDEEESVQAIPKGIPGVLGVDDGVLSIDDEVARPTPVLSTVGADDSPPEPNASTVDNRVLNAVIADHDVSKPLNVGTVYELRFNVAPPDVASLIGAKEQFKNISTLFKPDQDMLTLMLSIDGGDDFALWSADECKLYVPKQGNSKGSASFNIEPKHEGVSKLNAFVFLGDSLLQQWTFTFQVGRVPPGEDAMTVEKKGVDMGSAANLSTKRKNQSVNLVITALANGYNALLIGGSVSRARFGITEDNVSELVTNARAKLKEIVYTDKTGAGPYLRGIDIPADVHQATLNALAEIGYELFQTLFFGPDTADDAHAMGKLLQSYGATNSLRIQIAAEKFIFPWTLVYDKDLDGDATLEGFWGFKHIIEYLPLASGTITSFDPRIKLSGKLPVTFIANKAIDAQMKSPIIAGQEQFFATLADQIDLTEHTTSKDFLADLNNADLPAQLIYLYCHAESYAPGEKSGTTESKLLIDDTNAANALLVRQMIIRAPYSRAQLKAAPLIFLNACQGAELSPALYSGLVPYFVQKGARGVIGTEVDTPAFFAAEFAKRFFPRFLTGDETLGEVMLGLRREFAQQHNNVMGLVYAMYSNGDVCVVKGGA